MDKLSPSKARLLELCPRFQTDTRRDQTAADEGTALHEAVEKRDFTALMGDDQKKEMVAKVIDFIEEIIPKQAELHYELKVEGTYFRGTADLVALHYQNSTAYVCDWKFGRKPVDDAQYNLQVQAYVHCIFEMYPQIPWVKAYVYSPRTESMTTCAFSRSDMQAISTRAIALMARLEGCKEDPDFGYSPCEETCQWCALKTTCPALCTHLAPVATLWPEVKAALLDLTAPATPEIRSARQVLAGLFESWAEQAKKQNLAAVVEDGVEIPGFKLMKRSGAAKIKDTGRALDLSGMKIDHFLQACSVSLPKLASIAAALDGSSNSGAREELEEKLAGVIEREQDVVYLQRSKKKG